MRKARKEAAHNVHRSCGAPRQEAPSQVLERSPLCVACPGSPRAPWLTDPALPLAEEMGEAPSPATKAADAAPRPPALGRTPLPAAAPQHSREGWRRVPLPAATEPRGGTAQGSGGNTHPARVLRATSAWPRSPLGAPGAPCRPGSWDGAARLAGRRPAPLRALRPQGDLSQALERGPDTLPGVSLSAPRGLLVARGRSGRSLRCLKCAQHPPPPTPSSRNKSPPRTSWCRSLW